MNEKGTEAAAATAFIAVFGSAFVPGPQPPIFRVDHPFLFLIRHKATNSVLFFGILNDVSEL